MSVSQALSAVFFVDAIASFSAGVGPTPISKPAFVSTLLDAADAPERLLKDALGGATEVKLEKLPASRRSRLGDPHAVAGLL